MKLLFFSYFERFLWTKTNFCTVLKNLQRNIIFYYLFTFLHKLLFQINSSQYSDEVLSRLIINSNKYNWSVTFSVHIFTYILFMLLMNFFLIFLRKKISMFMLKNINYLNSTLIMYISHVMINQ